MRLKIEGGILLRPYALARLKTGGFSPAPNGWTPEELPEIDALATELMRDNNMTPQEARLRAWMHFEVERTAQGKRAPWPGWVPIVYQADRSIGRAYRRYFVSLNPNTPKDELKLQARAKCDNVVWPPDGLYEYKNGKMRPISGGEK